VTQRRGQRPGGERSSGEGRSRDGRSAVGRSAGNARPGGSGQDRGSGPDGQGPDRRRSGPNRNSAARKPQGASGRPAGQRSGDRPPGEYGRGGQRPADRRTPAREERTPPPPGLQKRPDEPRLPQDVDLRALPRPVKAELRGLPKDLAEVVAGHLITAGRLIDSDPELAYRHAEAARRRAARLPVVREAAAETAYAAGHWDVALSEFRALRRMTGTDDFLPVMADCERALGRPQAALKIAKEARRKQLDPALALEMIIVESGARSDLGQQPEARRVLHQAILELDDRRAAALGTPAARLYYAYADALESAGKQTEARQWFADAATLDSNGETDADERRDLLDGMLISFDDSDPDEPGMDPQVPGRDAAETS